jgi:predicted small secreted protein
MTDTQALIERLIAWAMDADCGLKMVGAGQDLKAAAAALTEAEAKLAKMQRSRDRYREAWEAEKARACLAELGEG